MYKRYFITILVIIKKHVLVPCSHSILDSVIKRYSITLSYL